MVERPEPDSPKPKLPSLPKAPEISKESRQKAFRYFFFSVFAILVFQLLRILAVFSDPLIWAGTLALIFFPMHQSIQKRLGKQSAASAAASTASVLLLVLVPLMLLSWVVLRQSAQVYPVVRDWIVQFRQLQDQSVQALLPEWAAAYWDRILAFAQSYGVFEHFENFDAQAFLLKHLNTTSRKLADFGGVAAKNIFFVLFNLAVVVIGLFFCFKDGEKLMRWILDIIPMQVSHSRAIGLRVYTTLTAIVRAALITAAVQGGLAGLGYVIAGVPLSIFFGVATGIAAMIPVVGAALFWLPIGVIKFTQDPFWGTFILVWGFFLVSMIDNLMKPILIGAGAKVHILLMFFAILGGVQVYGVTGIVLGPILTASVLAMVQIYREEYASKPRFQGGPGGRRRRPRLR